MKPRILFLSSLSLPFARAIAALLFSGSAASAAVYYWDNNGVTAGFGNASGTWAAPTTGSATQGWGTVAAGTTAPTGSITTLNTNSTTDAVNFGNGATGLGAGTINVGTVAAGSITFASGSGAILLSGGTITLTAAQTTTVDNATDTISSSLAGAGTSFTKAGNGSLVLSGANSYTGSTIINAGTLNLGGGTATGSLASTVLTLSGGALNYSVTGGQTQSFTTTNLNSGAAVPITVAAGNTLNLGTVTRGTGGRIDFATTGAGTVAAIEASNDATGIMAGLTFGDTWAVANGLGSPVFGLDNTFYTTTTAAGTIAANYAGINLDVDSSAGALDGPITANSLRFLNAAANTVTLADSTSNIITSGGILVRSTVGSNLSTITGGTLAGANTKDLIIRQNNLAGGLTISSIIGNNTGATALTKSGDGLLTLSASNTFTGGLIMNAGRVVVGNAGALNSTVASENAVTFSSGSISTLALNGNSIVVRSLDTNATPGTTIVENASASPATLTIGNAGNANSTFAGVLRDGTGGGALALTKRGTGTLTLPSANTYTGGTALTAGTVAISNASSLGAGAVTVTGTTARINAVGGITCANTLAVGGALTLGLTTQSSTVTYSGQLTGASAITITGPGGNGLLAQQAFTNTNNTFTGNVIMPSGNTVGYDTFSFNSIGDGGIFTLQKSGNQNTIAYTGSSNIVFNTRVLNIAATANVVYDGGGTNPVNMFANNGSGTVTFNTNMTVGAVTTGGGLVFGGTNTGDNTFAGTIPAGTGGLFGIAKTNAGKWILTGSNAYTGEAQIRNGILSVNTIDIAATNQPLGKNSVIQVGHLADTGTLEFTGGTNSTTDKQVRIGNSNSNSGNAGGAIILNNGNGSLTFSATTFNPTVATVTATRTLTLGGSNSGLNTIQGIIQDNVASTGRVALTKTGAGTWVLSGANTYSGGTNVNGGTLLLNGAVNMPATGTLAVGATGNFSLADGTVRNTTVPTLTLASGSLLSFDWSSEGTVDNLAPAAAVAPAAAAAIGIVINPIGTPTGTGLALLTGITGSTLNNPNYFLANNANFTATITKPAGAGAGSVTIGDYTTSGVVALTNAYWMRNQVTGATDTMAFSSGTTSNWASDAAGTSAGGVVPSGTGVNVIFGATTASSNVTVGADMNLGSITFNDTAAVTLSGNNFITLNSTSGTSATTTAGLATITNAGANAISAISVTSFANATNTISARLVLGANQTWNIADTKTLAVSGVVSGAGFTLTKESAGQLTLSGANNYTGVTNLNSGTLRIGNATALGTQGGVTDRTIIASGATLDLGGVVLGANNEFITASGAGVGGNGAITSSNQIVTPFIGVRFLTLAGDTTLGFTNRWDVGNNTTGGTLTGGGFTLNLVGSGLGQASFNRLGETDLGDININLGNAVTAIAYLQGNTTLGQTAKTVTISGGSSLEFFSNVTLTSYDKKFSLNTGNITVGKTGGVTLPGTISLTGTNIITANAAVAITASGVISGAGDLTKAGAGTLTLTGLNTYSGNTLVNGGTLALADDARLRFVLGATSGSNNSLTGAGTVTLAGDFFIDTTAADALASGSWTLENVSTLTGAYGSTFTVVGFVNAGSDKWTKVNGAKLYTFDETTGILTLVSADAYASWASGKGLTGLAGSATDPAKSADPDGDGNNNLYEFAFDGNPLSGANDGKIVGKIATVGGAQVLTLTLPVRGTATPTITPTFAANSGDQLSALIDGIYYRIEGDDTLSTFADTISEVTGTDATTIQSTMPPLSGAGWIYRTFRASGTVPTASRAFLRAKVSETP